MAEPQWGYGGEGGAMLLLDSDEADCLLNLTGAFGAHLRGLSLQGRRETKKAVHGVFLNNAQRYSPHEDAITIDDCKIDRFSGHGVHLLRIWVFLLRRNILMADKGCGVQITDWDGFVMNNQFSGNGSHGFGCEEVGATVMFTANRVVRNGGYGEDRPKETPPVHQEVNPGQPLHHQLGNQARSAMPFCGCPARRA